MALRSTIAVALGVILLAGTSGTAAGQVRESETQSWFVATSGWGKWVSLGIAAGLTTYGAIRSNDAQNQFTILETSCRTNSFFCRTGDDDTYLDPEAERLFQETLRLDGHAQKFLLGGQVSLLISGTMFLVDLLTGDDEPGNIPFTPLQVYSRPNRLGLQLGF